MRVIKIFFHVVREIISFPFVVVGMMLLVFGCMIGGRDAGEALVSSFEKTFKKQLGKQYDTDTH